MAAQSTGQADAARRALPWRLAMAAAAMLVAATRAARAAGQRRARAAAAPEGGQGSGALAEDLRTAQVLRRIRGLQEKLRKSPPP